MLKEDRSIFLLILTLVLYAVTSKINAGAFIFPFPLNELIFLGLAFYFAWLNKFRDKAAIAVVLSTALLGVISGIHNWAFILSDESLTTFDRGIWLDVLKIVYGLSLLFWFLVSTHFELNMRKLTIQILGTASLFLGFAFNVQLFILAFALFTCLILWLEGQLGGLKKLWIVFALLEFTRFLSFALVDL